MVNRRMFLGGASAATVLLTSPVLGQLATDVSTPVSNPSIDILANVVRNFLEHIDAFGGPEKHRCYGLQEKYYAWVNLKGDTLEAKIVETLRDIYNDPIFAEVKAEYGSIFSEGGRMNVWAQHQFPEHFPMSLGYAGTPQVFEAFASFAPAHLR